MVDVGFAPDEVPDGNIPSQSYIVGPPPDDVFRLQNSQKIS
jgi:hypothetical protein